MGLSVLSRFSYTGRVAAGDKLLAYAETHRRPVVASAVAVAAAIAAADWRIQPNGSLGMLYLFPVMLAAISLPYWEVVGLALACSFLREAYAPFGGQPGWGMRLALVWLVFSGTGVVVGTLIRKRRTVLERLRERQDAEQQMRVLVEATPLAILTLDASGRVLAANARAHQLLRCDAGDLAGQDIRAFLPVLKNAVRHPQSTSALHTCLECRGRRRDGEVFLAHLWCSSYRTASGPRLAAVVWDASESLRDRAGAGLDALMTGSRMALGAVAQELRELATAAAAAHAGLARVAPMENDQDYQALGALLEELKSIVSSGLPVAFGRTESAADLTGILGEARIVLEPALREADITASWEVPEGLPLVRGDHLALLQVFLNLARNSQRAMEDGGGQLRVAARLNEELVEVRFEDTGRGVAAPERLFRPFQEGEGADRGLYVSRAILRACGGDLWYEPRSPGACFVVQLALWEGAGGRAV